MSLVKAILHYIQGFLIIGQHYLSWQLWYLLSFIYALIIILFLQKFNLSDKKIIFLTFLIYLFGVTMVFLTKNYNYLTLIHLFSFFLGSGRILTGMFLIFFGLCINKYNLTINKNKLIPLIIICFIVSIIVPNEISKVVLYILIFIFSKQINNLKLNTIYLRKSSTIFYFLHMWNLFIYLLIVGKENAYGLYSFLLNILICIIESIIIIYIQNKYNFKFINDLFDWSSSKK